MPISLPDFLKMSVESEVPDIFGDLLKGYQISQEPRRMRDEAMQRELANQMMQMQNEFYPQVQQQNLDIGDVNLQSGRLNLDALPGQLSDEASLRSMNMDQMRTNNPLQTMLLNAQIQAQQAAAKKSNFQSDPQAQMKYIKDILTALGGDNKSGTGKAPDFSGMTPLQQSIIEKATGLKLKAPQQTPEQKEKSALDLFEKKEKIKSDNQRNKDLTELTPTERTRYQAVVREVNSISPVMSDLVKNGGEAITKAKTANDLKYLGKVKRIADVYMKAKGWPNTNEARNDAIELFKRGAGESNSAYKSRMKELEDELMHEVSLAEGALGTGRVESSSKSSSKDPLGIM